MLFKLRRLFDSAQALALPNRIAEEIHLNALSQSCALAEAEDAHPGFAESRATNGGLQFDYGSNAAPHGAARRDGPREKIKQHGLRNSLLIAIAPNATIASTAGCVARRGH